MALLAIPPMDRGTIVIVLLMVVGFAAVAYALSTMM